MIKEKFKVAPLALAIAVCAGAAWGDTTVLDRTRLPILQPAFSGQIAENASESSPSWPVQIKAPHNAPNIIVIMTDDIGYGASSTFGGPIPTQALDALSKDGARYSNFHTTAMCSPSRAALLTGRNHHDVGAGAITDVASGYPGYNSIIPLSAAPLAEVLKENGYNTAQFGKHHNIPHWENNLSGSFEQWPTGLGFEYFYGFTIGSTDQWSPRLYRNTVSIDEPLPSGTVLDKALADDAIHWIHQQKATTPDKPFFIYYAPGSGHAPHQAPADWIANFKGKFDLGWDLLREQTFNEQKRLGILPADAKLSPRPAEIPAWSTLPAQTQRLYAKHMEVYAAMVAYQDSQIGRLLNEVDRMGQLDNTIVVYIEGDNGASAEGGPIGTQNEVGMLGNKITGLPKDIDLAIKNMGTANSQPLYPVGWAWALDAPFPWTKQVASHLGAITNGMVIRWGKNLKDANTIRSQFSHITDIYPTVLDTAGIPAPEIVNGVKQTPLNGKSLKYSFVDAHAEETHTRQYFEMFGNRAIYDNGWLANTKPKRMPWQFVDIGGRPSQDYEWELYNLRKDPTQSTDIASSHPEKLKEMEAIWADEAKSNNVFPLDDRTNKDRVSAAHMHYVPHRSHYEYWGSGLSVAESAAPPFQGKSFTLTADLTLATDKETGVIVARGSQFGGWSFYLKNGVPKVTAAFSQEPGSQYNVSASTPLKAGKHTIKYSFTTDNPIPLSGGKMCIEIDNQNAVCGHLEKTVARNGGQGETFDVGQDLGVPVTTDYPAMGRMKGVINKVIIDLEMPSSIKKS